VSTVIGPDFIALQVRDIERAAEFYERELGLTRAPGPPHAVVFATQPIAFALRDPLPGTDLDRGQPSLGVALWLRADDAQALHDPLAQHDVTILTEPIDGPSAGRSRSETRTATPSRSTIKADELSPHHTERGGFHTLHGKQEHWR
jgi:catechol 2,3-dioxygenase-like lactoylglutathione lyase family enzyme